MKNTEIRRRLSQNKHAIKELIEKEITRVAKEIEGK